MLELPERLGRGPFSQARFLLMAIWGDVGVFDVCVLLLLRVQREHPPCDERDRFEVCGATRSREVWLE